MQDFFYHIDGEEFIISSSEDETTRPTERKKGASSAVLSRLREAAIDNSEDIKEKTFEIEKKDV